MKHLQILYVINTFINIIVFYLAMNLKKNDFYNLEII